MQSPVQRRLSVAEFVQSIPGPSSPPSISSYNNDHRRALAQRTAADLEAGRARMSSNYERWESTDIYSPLRDVGPARTSDKPFLYRNHSQRSASPVRYGETRSRRIRATDVMNQMGHGTMAGVGSGGMIGEDVFAWERAAVLHGFEVVQKGANFDTLPGHLLGRIAGFLDSGDQCRLLRVCKATLHPVAEVIYSSAFVHDGEYDLMDVLSGLENDRYTSIKPYGRGLKLAFLRHVETVRYAFTRSDDSESETSRSSVKVWQLDALLRSIPNEIVIFPKVANLVFINCSASDRALMDLISSRSISHNVCVSWSDTPCPVNAEDRVKRIVHGNGHIPQTVTNHNLKLNDDINLIFSHASVNKLEFNLEGEACCAIAEQRAEVVLNFMRVAYAGEHGFEGQYDEEGGITGVLFTEWEIEGIGRLSGSEKGWKFSGDGEIAVEEGDDEEGGSEEEDEDGEEDRLDEELMLRDVEKIILDEIPLLAGRIRFTRNRAQDKCLHCDSGSREDEGDWVVV